MPKLTRSSNTVHTMNQNVDHPMPGERQDSAEMQVIYDIARRKMLVTLEHQRNRYLAEGAVKIKRRIHRIERAIRLLINNQDRLLEAMNADFGYRSSHQSLLTDIAASVTPLKFALAQLRKWVKPHVRSIDLTLALAGAKGWVEYQPLGVVGLISPWNFPVQLTFGPLASILAAGNRVMIKPSEYTPATSSLMQELIAETYDEDEVTVITGDAITGQIFSSLPFDHLMFTGSASAARQVMHSAADNLVPLTLELGGKSPVIIGRGAAAWTSASRIMFGKALNAGQICLAPDYVLLPHEKLDTFVELAQKVAQEMFPSLLNNPDYSSIINDHHYRRLQDYIEDARQKGANIIEINPAQEDFTKQPHNKMPITLITNTHDHMHVMRDEIFGPILPIKQYKELDDAIAYVNQRPRPLALYYFGTDKREEKEILKRTTSGGVVFNDVVTHFSQENLPFGGVGQSGMGAYKGRDGFENFSHKKAVFVQSKFHVMKKAGLLPPWGTKSLYFIKRALRI